MIFARTHWARWGLLLAVAAASYPAWTGDWVYDDWGMVRSGAQDGLDDLLAVFSRTSADYIANRGGLWPFGVTYRPLSMLSLIGVQVVSPKPWLHHLLSLAMHVACVAGLYAGVRRMSTSESDGRVAALASAVFALHPLGIEAYGWINGRSDVLACAFLAGLAAQLPFTPAAASARQLVMIALCAGGAALSKEPALVAVLALLFAAMLADRGAPDRARWRLNGPALAAGVSGLVIAGAARLWVVRGSTSGAQALLSDPELVSTYAAALRLAAEHMLVPLPRSMLSLAVELSYGASLVDWILLAAATAGLLLLCVQRRYRALVLLAGALVALLPVLPVRHLLWLGFDRYLYIPLFLTLLALGSLAAVRGGAALTRRGPQLASHMLLMLLAFSSFATARAYESQNAWLSSLVLRRQDDPSGWVMAADWFLREGDRPRARAMALGAPRSRLPPAISHDLAELLINLNLRSDAIAVMEQTFRVFPDQKPARFDALVARGMQGRFAEAYELADSLKSERLWCEAARGWVSGWLKQPDLPAAERPRTAAFVASYRCE